MVERGVVSLSIVSHGQGALITRLLDDIGHPDWRGDTSFEVIVTLNIPEDERWLEGPFPFPVTVIRNERPKGFGANHNAAFRSAGGALFAVVNPDIRLASFRIDDLIIALNRDKAGVCGPLVKAPDGADEDSARRFPTIARLVRRKLRTRHAPDYRPSDMPLEVDWLAGMFLLFPSSIYREIGGFDERYFMYLEDVEICRHLGRRGRVALWVTSTAVIHDASRASRRSIRHLRWHVSSLARYLCARKRRRVAP
jgi:GT2 family glycosyltransferase